ncbi:conjugal transfer protein TraH (plasmid) [Legionella israelensis]|uniref:conjugal transfer protein TraH n=1 Tax=Legionella israelensis TaxID=454 RepID=UPI00117F449E|nr:conjugal transfer protein TraH [Legionella israelensis]QDP73729.1 conjugal transfer protein TraH [Legionella israelensis]
MKSAFKKGVAAGFFLNFSLSFAGVSGDLDTFFNGLGYDSNTTSPGAYESQAAGSYGSGSLVVRNQVKQFQLVQLDMPSVSSGCLGIDLYTGSISFIKGKRLKELGKAVMSNSAAYAFDVALATTVPELKQIKDNLQALEQKMNQANINSCQLSQNLVGGLWPKTKASQEKICHDQGTMGDSGMFSDYVQARQGCAGSDFNRALEKAEADPKQKDEVIVNKNIIWSMLKDKSALSSDTELAELMMSLTGTIIVDKDGHVTEVPSLIKNQDLIAAILGRDDGNPAVAKIWSCIEKEKCMKVHLKEITIAKEKSFKARVSKLIKSLYEHIKTDDAEHVSVAEKNLVAMSHIPIFRFLTVLAASEYGVNAVDLNDYSSLLAQDLLTQYLSELLGEVKNVTAGSMLTEAMVETLEKRINHAEQAVAQMVPEVGHRLDEKLRLVERVRSIEKQIAVNAHELMG